MRKSGEWRENFDARPYPAGRLCEGKINGDGVNRKECHYGGYHFRDRGKPEVFAGKATLEKVVGKPITFCRFPLGRGSRVVAKVGLYPLAEGAGHRLRYPALFWWGAW